jgi:hypothetical protein
VETMGHAALLSESNEKPKIQNMPLGMFPKMLLVVVVLYSCARNQSTPSSLLPIFSLKE